MVDEIVHKTLKATRKFYQVTSNRKPRIPPCIHNADLASKAIYDSLISESPCMIGRFGSTELSAVSNYVSIRMSHGPFKWIKFIKGEIPAWWFDSIRFNHLETHSGFFPSDLSLKMRFCDLMLDIMPKVDILGSWLPEEMLFEDKLKNSFKIYLELLNPYFSEHPWTLALKDKKVLVIHPFAKTIESQFKKRKLFFDKEILPDFNLSIIKAVQGLAKTPTGYKSWFEALENMQDQIQNTDFDICLIGAGAYGMPLAAFVKSIGKKAVHLGGSLQLLFGIRGKRWENPYYNPTYNYSSLMNEHWVKPLAEETPERSSTIEGGCYW